MHKKDKLSVVKWALPSALIGYLGNVGGVAYARSKGWAGDGGVLDGVSHANNFFDSMITTSAASLAIDTLATPRNLPLRKALAVGGVILGIGIGLNAVSETHLAHERPFSILFSEQTSTDQFDFLYGSAASVLGAAAMVNTIRQRDDTLQLPEPEFTLE